MYYRIKSKEIQDINIFISNEDNKQIKLFKDTPTIVKLIIKSQSKMDFTSNLIVSSKALPPHHSTINIHYLELHYHRMKYFSQSHRKFPYQV